jgi:hypothetical protein
MSRKFALMAGGAGFLVAASVGLTATMAHAQPFQRQPYEEWQYETKRPQRGYEGFPAPGVYCSYRREPIRTCTSDRNGRERCRVTSWRLVQFCS